MKRKQIFLRLSLRTSEWEFDQPFCRQTNTHNTQKHSMYFMLCTYKYLSYSDICTFIFLFFFFFAFSFHGSSSSLYKYNCSSHSLTQSVAQSSFHRIHQNSVSYVCSTQIFYWISNNTIAKIRNEAFFDNLISGVSRSAKAVKMRKMVHKKNAKWNIEMNGMNDVDWSFKAGNKNIQTAKTVQCAMHIKLFILLKR